MIMDDFLAQCLRKFDDAYNIGQDERLQSQEDRRFYSITGAQYEGNYARLFENRAKPEFNKCHQAVIRAIAEYRNNRIDVDFIPKDGKSDELADLCDGLYRADFQDSQGLEAVDNAYEEALGGGFGAFRLCNEYEDDEDEDDDKQRIRFEPIPDADQRVFFDPTALRMDKSDADWSCVLTPYSVDSYIETFGDDPTSWPIEKFYQHFDWCNDKNVYVAEWYQKEQVTETVLHFVDSTGEKRKVYKSEYDEDEQKELAALGFVLEKSKKVKKTKIHKYLLSGSKILEDCGYIAGKHIPIVPVYCKRWYVNGIERFMGIVRPGKDPQRIKNALIAILAEIATYPQIRKPIFVPEQVAGLSHMWANDTIERNPYLLVNKVTGADGSISAQGPVAILEPPTVPQSLAALLTLTEQDIQEILGNNQSADKLVSNVSGQAVDMIQQRVDVNLFLPMSNLARALQRAGQIWLSMAKDIYTDDDREMKYLGKENEPESRKLKSDPYLDEETGKVTLKNDLSRADFDVYADVGPTSTSKRNSVVKNLMAIHAQEQDPQRKTVLASLIMQNMEGEGLADVRKYYRNMLLDIGAVEPTDDEKEELQAKAMQNMQPTPEQQYLIGLTEQANADATKSRVETVLNLAKAEETKAKTMKTLAEIDQSEQDMAVKNMQVLAQSAQAQPAAPSAENGVNVNE
jgi:hypothetical protein